MIGVFFVAVLLLSGCKKKMCNWGDYESNLHDHYKSPENRGEFKAALGTLLEEAEKSKCRVPPGIYAEYGYLQYLFKEYGGAVKSYLKEKELFPESAYLMDILIGNIEKIKKRMEKG
jgi:hypothetical protein